MKKRFLSILLILAMIISLTPAANVSAADSSDFENELTQKIQTAADYLCKNAEILEPKYDAPEYYQFLIGGYDLTKYKSIFFESLDMDLDRYGHVVNKQKNMDAGINGAILLILKYYGIDPACYQTSEGTTYNLLKDFQEITPDTNPNTYGYTINPYYYSTAVEAAYEYHLDDYAKAMIDYDIQECYTLGKGYNYAGFNCDNLSMFLTTILPYKDDYSEYVTDATSLLKTYEKATGYCYTSTYEANGDSTALALYAYASAGDLEEAYTQYYNLITYFETSEGLYRWKVDQDGSLTISTRDAVTGLVAFRSLIQKNQPDSYIKTISFSASSLVYNGKIQAPALKAVNNSDSALINGTDYDVAITGGKYVGTATAVYTLKNGYSGSISCEYKIIPKGTSISKLKKGKKSFKVTYKKQSTQTSGYQIQYGTSSSMSGAKTTTVSSYKTVSKTIKSLKSKKKYYVRVRTYKTVSGTKYYSAWSSKKTVKTK